MEREALHREACKLVDQPNKFGFTQDVTPANSTVPSQRVTISLFQWLFRVSISFKLQ